MMISSSFLRLRLAKLLEERRRLRPIGRNNKKYQEMLQELRATAMLAEDLGYDVLTTTEHHFHSGGL